MKTILVIGANSHIYSEIKWRMGAYNVVEYPNECFGEKALRWDICLIFIGKVAPVGNWWEQSFYSISNCIECNLIDPWRLLHCMWDRRNPDATVIWFSGSNPQKIMDGYAPYNASKMAVNKLVEQLDHETPDAKFVAFGPGYVRDSKIHAPTLESNWPNERIARGDAGTSSEDIWNALKFCIEAPKSVVGGRNIAVSDLPLPDTISESAYKLRRL